MKIPVEFAICLIIHCNFYGHESIVSQSFFLVIRINQYTPMLYKKDGKRLANPYGCRGYTALKHFARNKPMVNLRIGSISGHLFFPFVKAGGLQIRRCQGLAVVYYGGALVALALKPSDFCNIGVYQCPCPHHALSERSEFAGRPERSVAALDIWGL